MNRTVATARAVAGRRLLMPRPKFIVGHHPCKTCRQWVRLNELRDHGKWCIYCHPDPARSPAALDSARAEWQCEQDGKRS